ncbi:uncharacterized protein LOC121688716 [Alosa sapidissima]|uniref:uncharacterized protein LOC121688716 n=1 Tax=Alosa sapidissima TaxID=34773 RepID=UPI001C084AC7|nr:uncharacterized protein LOC121688716 [Alosa sapidissima]
MSSPHFPISRDKFFKTVSVPPVWFVPEQHPYPEVKTPMTSTTVDEDLTLLEVINDTQPSQIQPGQGEDDDNTVCRSSRLANRTPSAISIGDWPVSRILETLFQANIQPPIGACHEDLFVLLCDSQDIPPAADILPGLPPPQTSGRKQTQKRKHIEPAGTAHKRAGGQVRPGPSAPPANDPVIAALSNIQASLLDMTARISTLESDSIRPSSSPTVISASGVSTAPELRHLQHQPQRDDVTPEFIPRRSLATAVPLTTDSPFFPPSSAIPHHLRSQILAGNDINLVKILLGSELCERRVIATYQSR